MNLQNRRIPKLHHYNRTGRNIDMLSLVKMIIGTLVGATTELITQFILPILDSGVPGSSMIEPNQKA